MFFYASVIYMYILILYISMLLRCSKFKGDAAEFCKFSCSSCSVSDILGLVAPRVLQSSKSCETCRQWLITDASLLQLAQDATQECDDALHKCKKRFLEEGLVE